MNRRSWLMATTALALTWICITWVDHPAAVWIHVWMSRRLGTDSLGFQVPDCLPAFSALVTAGAWICFSLSGRWRPRPELHRTSLRLGLDMPAAFLAKAAGKFIFGRETTRQYLVDLQSRDFHWFHGLSGLDGFPSGHMTLAATLVAALWVPFPGYRKLMVGSLLVLGIALVLTNYHFISDVLAGALLGYLVNQAVLGLVKV